jgi:RIO kinase 1
MEPVIIDMGQSVMIDHFNAEAFLRRDVENIARFFKKLKIPANEEKMISTIKEETK